MIGHEITHGFDNQGAQFDKDGNAENWWDDVTKVQFFLIPYLGCYMLKVKSITETDNLLPGRV